MELKCLIKPIINVNPWKFKKILKKKLKNNFKKDKKRFYTKKEGEEYSKDYINKNGDLPCTYCGKTLDPSSHSKDHYYPHNKGGLTTKENYRPSCTSCKSSKGAKLPLKQIKMLIGKYKDVKKQS